MWGIIATWRMGLEGVQKASKILAENGDSGDAIEIAVREVEDFPYYKSVGYGGLPNSEMELEMDAAYMNGNSLNVGAVGAIKDFANPISIARSLSHDKVNNFLVGLGAEKYASRKGFERKTMLTERAKIHYHNRLKEINQEITPYAGHDTVGMVALDQNNKMTAATSTSGLFMKRPGRVGDSPVVGSGFYVESDIGGATATGLGEDIMKGCLSYQIVRLMAEGFSPQEACDKVVTEFSEKLIKLRGTAGDISVVALNKAGEFGCATNIDDFSFVVATANQEPIVYVTKRIAGKTKYEKAGKKWLSDYMKLRTRKLERNQ